MDPGSKEEVSQDVLWQKSYLPSTRPVHVDKSIASDEELNTKGVREVTDQLRA